MYTNSGLAVVKDLEQLNTLKIATTLPLKSTIFTQLTEVWINLAEICMLRLPHRNDAEIAKICNILTCNHGNSANKPSFQNVQRLQIFANLASFLWSNLNTNLCMKKIIFCEVCESYEI